MKDELRARPKNSWRSLAVYLLREHGPMTASQLVELIKEKELRQITGKTPEATVGAALYTAIKRGDEELILMSPGLFSYNPRGNRN